MASMISTPSGPNTSDLPYLSQLTSQMTPALTTVSEDPPLVVNRCDIVYKYDVAPATICAVCFVFGVLYAFLGYRFFKAIMFMTGFIFGSVLTYVLLDEHSQLPTEANAGIAVGVGVLLGLITMLVQYVGLFATGFTFGLFLATIFLVILELFYHPSTKWISIGVLFILGVVFALLALKFQKSMTVLGTSLFGGALMFICLDYYAELFIMSMHILNVLKVEPEAQDRLCWFSWVIAGVWLLIFVLGVVIQWKLTSKGCDHRDVKIRSKKHRKVNLQKIRSREKEYRSEEDPNTRYRHLYQIRRSNGDVISRSIIDHIHPKMSPTTHKLTSDDDHPPYGVTNLELTNKSEQDRPFGMTPDIESANTTLTQVAPEGQS
ncbi:transmembrane protein 198 [Lingula anatina]|uniref:Transmembrane protein 198 n=1 Tax=Lingula anatina TaxID=7574 RepID=A0A1S3KF08_LINAN|nr:transmembrane protein 198 [Lingula anatina]XP_013420832.1 transmembrane protein 198 [Lingula anatina]XP_013420833.1 transmembrane protein 198 [Lingula anatina]|eukprot:XP_013420831.1 transmembrane protein 198 [Lingula anatina]